MIRRSTFARRAAFVVAFLVVLAGSGSAVQRSSAAPPPRPYAVTLSPGSAVAGATVSETLTLTNRSLIPLGSSVITLPSGYSATVASVTGPPVLPFLQNPRKNWSATIVGSAINLSANNILNSLLYNETVKVVLSVTVPCVAPLSSTWVTQASGSIPFLPLSGFASTGDPSITATGSCSFRFDQISSPQTAGAPIGVHVQTLDGIGAPTAAFNGSAVLSGSFGSSPNGDAPSYGSLAFANGAADTTATTFKADMAQNLTANDAVDGITGPTSNSFDVNPGPVSSVKFLTGPTKTQVNQAIAPMTVGVTDQWGNPESTDVTLSIVADPYGGTTLGGTTTRTAADGVATFDNISLNHGGSGFTLGATSAAANDTSSPFDVFDAICTMSSCSATNPAGDTAAMTAGVGTTIQMSPSGEPFSVRHYRVREREGVGRHDRPSWWLQPLEPAERDTAIQSGGRAAPYVVHPVPQQVHDGVAGLPTGHEELPDAAARRGQR